MNLIYILALTKLAKIVFSAEAIFLFFALCLLASVVLLFMGVDKEIRREMEFYEQLKG